MRGAGMDTVKRKNWFKRLFILDYDVQLAPLLESIDPILENIQIQQIEIDEAHLKIDGLSEAVKVVARQVESVEEKLNLIKTFDYQGKILYAQANIDMNASGNSDIVVSIDNVNKAAYLRFGSSEAVDTVNAVWFISKTGNKIKNDFGDELSPSAPRLTVQDFLRMTQEKQGDAPLEDLVPPHTHDVYQGEIEDLDARVEILESSASGDAFDDSELKKGIADNSTEIAVNTANIAVNTAGIESNSAAIGANYVRCEENELKTIENAFQIALVDGRVNDIEEFLGGVYFEVSLGVDRWIFDTGSVPGEGNFTAFSYDFSATNTEYWINEFAAGSAINNWEDARPGDKFNVTAQNNGDTNYGKYVISTIEKSDGIWDITGDFVEGQGRLTAGLGYFIEILHGSKQFEPDNSHSDWEDRITKLESMIDYLESSLQHVLPFSLGVHETKMDRYEPTGSTQAEGTAVTWWIDAVNNTTPENHARIGMVDKDLCSKVANMPVPFEMDVIQGDLKQTWVIADCYERGAGVLHLLSSGGWGDRMVHTTGTAVATEYVVRKI